jgi:hypothetical protein
MEDDIRNQLRRRDRRPAGGAAQKQMLKMHRGGCPFFIVGRLRRPCLGQL